jgi:alanine-synthesizing transaminase
MGNPDQPTPEHIVEKLVEAARRSDTHRYSASRGIPRLRCAISNWYKNRFDVAIDGNCKNIFWQSFYSWEIVIHGFLASFFI